MNYNNKNWLEHVFLQIIVQVIKSISDHVVLVSKSYKKSYKSYKSYKNCYGYNDISMVITVIKKVINTVITIITESYNWL